MKIYTRRGDQGQTDLFGGERVSKDHLRVECYGCVDELNAVVGVCASATAHAELRAPLARIQAELFSLGAYLATPDPRHRAKAGVAEPGEASVAELEREIDAFEAELAPLRRFILPGGSAGAAAFHLARTVCRRAERRAVELHRGEPLAPAALHYLNRLSDYFFVLARVENHRSGVPDVEWEAVQPR